MANRINRGEERPFPRANIRAGRGLRHDDLSDDDDWDDEGIRQDAGHRQQRGAQQADRGARRARGGAGGGRGGGGAPRGGRKLDRRFLQELEKREAPDCVMTLSHPDAKLRDSIRECAHDQGLLQLMMSVLAKTFTCDSQPQSLNRIRIIMTEEKFFDIAMELFFDMDDVRQRQNAFKKYIKDMIGILHEIMDKNPTSIVEFFGLHELLNGVIGELRGNTNIIDQETLASFQELTEVKEHLRKRLKNRTKKKTPEATRREELEEEDPDPPNDFRDIEIFPQRDDMQADDDRYLRANKIRGKYQDLDHYLDVQFRLLREDFVAPLREGVSEYIQAMQENRRKKGRDVRIYHNTRILTPHCSENGLCHVIQFDVTRTGNVRWQSTKRLIFGSLLCMSSDNFRTFLFATVVAREIKTLQKGILTVRFEKDHREVNGMMNQLFTMAETTAYFESYKHVLKGLQSVRRGDLPFERYIIECESHVQPPAYLRRRPNTNYDLRPLVDEHIVIKDKQTLEIMLGEDEEDDAPVRYDFSPHSREAEKVKVLDPHDWPTADLLHLDPSQYRAIRTALSNEFVITQGPPGTGKTYIGLKIVKALLHNKDAWTMNPDTGLPDPRPMLIVCYTNHALDQFLEGIISFYKGDIVRVGGRSNSEILKPYNLHNFRQRFRHERKIPVQVFKGRREAKFEMDSLTANIRKVSEEIQLVTNSIMHEDFLRPYMGNPHYHLLIERFEMMMQMYHEMREVFKNCVIVEWLELGNLAPVVEMERNMAGDFNVNDVGALEEEFIDADDEVDNIQAQRQIDERGEDDDEDEINAIIDGLLDVNLTRKERIDMHVNLATKATQRNVALDIDQMDEMPKGVQNQEWQTQKKQKKKQKRKVRQKLSSNEVMTQDDVDAITDMWTLSLEDKWKLYRFWIEKYRDVQLRKIEETQDEFERAAERYREALMQEDKEIMRHSRIIGMTTTGAARYQAVLQEIRPRIIVVEEAAEVLEAHIVTTLSRGCEHLILIGDHKQLKPNPTVYELAKKYKLDVSLFERMVDNGIQCDCLELQHRMRPEISLLMTHIYPDLKDHQDVRKYDSIKGISSNVFFINHNESESDDTDLRSHSNVHEAEFLVGLCRYLLLQGYKPDQITVLTLYSGQLFCLKNMMPKSEFEGVRLTVVDNYQGEENDIILLSLVRSNNDNSIGFLKSENRTCVALSRAKKGFFAIGNFDLLRNNSKLWNEIVIDMKQRGFFGDGLLLRCQNHPDADEQIVAKTAKDFQNAPEGGCARKCGTRLECGHLCEQFCHVIDAEHLEKKCRKRCNKPICQLGHKCPLPCSKACQPCKELVDKKIPRCGHSQKVSCATKPQDFECKAACESILPCGHKCQAKCGKQHTQECAVEVEKTWPCGHAGKIKCHQQDIALCPAPCGKMLSCEHRCLGTCGKCFQGRLHRTCKSGCIRILVCGHECTKKCNLCPPCVRPCENRCQHSKCPKPCGELCAPCREPCTWHCIHHRCRKLCSEPCDRPPCNEPCNKRLICGHLCIGMCGEPCPTDCRVCDQEKVTNIMFGDEDEPDARFVMMQDCKKRCIIEVKAMDKYMQERVDHRGEIKLKECPICKTAIRSTTRYRALVNEILSDIENVKRRVLLIDTRLAQLEKDIKDALDDYPDGDERRAMRARFRGMPSPKSENELTAFINQLQLLKHLQTVEKEWNKIKGLAFEDDKQQALIHVRHFTEWLLEERSIMTAQESKDAECELGRLKALYKLIMFQLKAKERAIQLDINIKTRIREAEHLLKGFDKYIDGVQITVETCLDQLDKLIPKTGLGISDAERVMILQAMSLPKGHWFKCPKGHIYAIGDCGGANQESKCPECGSTIGGMNYRLRDGNRLAEEMDNAAAPAWGNPGMHGFNIQYVD